MPETLIRRLACAERLGASYSSRHGDHHQRLQLDEEIRNAQAVDVWDSSRCHFVQVLGDAAEELSGRFIVRDIAVDPESIPSRLKVCPLYRADGQVDSQAHESWGFV